jgi:cytochrome P450
MPPVAYDPFDPAIIRDPHPVYERMRREDPICFVPEYDAFGLTRFEDIWAAAGDPGTFSVEQGTTSAHLLTRKMQPYAALGNLDPPRHTERRKLINSLLVPGAARKLEPGIRRIAELRVAPLRDRGSLDGVRDYAAHVATGSLCLATGLPVEDAEMLRGWVDTIFFRSVQELGLDDAGVAAYAELANYALELIRRYRANPTRDGGVVDRYVSAKVEGGRQLSDEEIAGHLREFFIGGTETFQKVLAAGIHRLFEHPDQRREVAENPALAKHAFLEGLRLDTPGQFMGRTVARDTTLQGVAMRKGQVVLLIWPSGNRDASEFESPDRFDIHRRPPRMLGFGAGTHDCVGRHVATLEGRIAIETLLSVAPEYEVDLEGATRTASEFVHGFTSLPLRS